RVRRGGKARFVSHHVPIDYYIWIALVLFGIGLFGFLSRRNVITLLLCMELMVNAVNVLLVAFNRNWGVEMTRQAFLQHGTKIPTIPSPIGQIFVIFSITIAVAEAALGLGIIILLYRNLKAAEVDQVNILKW
ncbi:MAG: NADH-quinone oxidoreductase subunit NuoK, partial [bacterium]